MQHSTSFLTMFALQCQHKGGNEALVHNELSWSYTDLDRASDVIAADLGHQGIVRGSTVALLCERSVQAIAAMIGVLKTGARFLPIDPALPAQRIRFMLDDAATSGIIADNNQSALLQSLNLSSQISVKWISDNEHSENECSDNKSSAISGKLNTRLESVTPTCGDAAYVMYTSGSTGQPKGVVIPHSALACYCRADSQVYKLSSSDRTLQFSTLSFDISIEEIFPPLCVGSTVVLRPDARSEAQIELSDIIERYRISAVHLATGYWHEWVDLMKACNATVPSSLRLMVVTGEKVSPEHYYCWRSLITRPVLWANAYGPTEATVSATVFIPPSDWQGNALPIGRPLPGYTVHILDSHRQAVAPGCTGDLYIGGAALSSGYLNRPELNRSVFVPDPFDNGGSARLYKTGDLARWMDDGNIEYAGRVDHQIKVGSYRVEPGEIENTINGHAGVKESLVAAESINGTTQLIAYIARADASLCANDVADYLADKLPVYMVPDQYLLMNFFPKTINGKIDRDALPDSKNAVSARRGVSVSPKSETEQQLCRIWQDILPVSDVGIDDSFVSLGGDSLMAIKAIARIQRELNFTVSTRDFFFLDTIALLAGHMEGKEAPRLVPAPAPDFINSRGRQLYTVLQKPSPHNDNGQGLLLVPPLGNEQRRAQRPFRILMQNLSRQGYSVLRFDWHGTANSSGNTSQLTTLQSWVDDVQDAAQLLAAHVDSIDMVAIRLGALIASLTPSATLPIRSRYYWDPVISGKYWLQDMDMLHRGILNDTYRFLWPRRSTSSLNAEYAGLELNQSLSTELENTSLVSSLNEHAWNQSAQLIVTESFNTDALNQFSCAMHKVDELTNWTDPRATTDDMLINRAASKLVTLINQQQTYPIDSSMGRRHA